MLRAAVAEADDAAQHVVAHQGTAAVALTRVNATLNNDKVSGLERKYWIIEVIGDYQFEKVQYVRLLHFHLPVANVTFVGFQVILIQDKVVGIKLQPARCQTADAVLFESFSLSGSHS